MQGHGYTGPLTACANITEDVKMLIGRFLNLKNIQRKPMDIVLIGISVLNSKRTSDFFTFEKKSTIIKIKYLYADLL